MREPDSNQFRAWREDVVVSVCLSDLAPSDATFKKVCDLAAELDAVYRFREIILVVEATQREAFLPLVEQVPDLRLFVVRPGTEYYARRVIAAEEAIGDVVLLGNLEELSHMDALAFLARAEEANAITLANRSRPRPVKRVLASPFVALGRLAGFKVDPSDFQSIAVPRTLLNHLLAHPEPRLALRFPPRDPGLPLEHFAADKNVASRTAFSHLSRRAQLLQTLLVYLTPTILSIVAISSSVLALVGLAYSAYIVGVLFVVEDLAPGWLTTNAMLAVSAVFMGLSTLGLSLGLQHVLKLHSAGSAAHAAEEVNRIDLFGKVASDLNVELDQEAPDNARADG
ncbi:MAG: hypothetical protein AAF697_02890 [Pseudomonadota bacterium]